jgi:hypothetical protein
MSRFRGEAVAPLASMLSQALACPATSWSRGEYGAIAEFHHSAEAGV